MEEAIGREEERGGGGGKGGNEGDWEEDDEDGVGVGLTTLDGCGCEGRSVVARPPEMLTQW